MKLFFCDAKIRMYIYAVGNQLLQTAMASHKPMQQRSVQFYFRDQAIGTGTSESGQSSPITSPIVLFFVRICQFQIRSIN